MIELRSMHENKATEKPLLQTEIIRDQKPWQMIPPRMQSDTQASIASDETEDESFAALHTVQQPSKPHVQVPHSSKITQE